MQLQAERDYFVHGGIGGGSSSSSSSSSSPSCSPPKESPLSLIKVNNLKKPRTKAREEKEKRKASDVDTASAVSSSVASAIPLGQPSHNLNGDINVTIDIDVNVNRDINPRKNATDISKTDTLCNCQETEQNSIKAEAMVETQSNHLHTEPMDSESTSADLAPQLPSSLQPASSFLSLYPLAIPAPPPAPTASSAISKHVHATITGHTKSVSRHQEQNSVRSPQKNVPAMDTSISYSSCKTIPVSSLIPVSAGAAASTILLSTREDVSSSIHGYVPSGSLSILATDRLSQLPWELLFHIFCLLDAFDLSCVAQVVAPQQTVGKYMFMYTGIRAHCIYASLLAPIKVQVSLDFNFCIQGESCGFATIDFPLISLSNSCYACLPHTFSLFMLLCY
ncbi:hypothetical protein BCR41DRAFT_416143 [Lobosporangium transversale]|uniref:F-box domain-containing protein n=1 Tax=Lobosporangium transversale TaxID=64571 RepID=A0A1Y2GUR5_9FUNG|nr:hypothetical protein BCR41DRAFT_416143 [Lobosporangium transversale]ORZ24830.1 hypothetical protein BCR41DRAFT_416143 [Lobosporangium transversale]|eukprot:XP_021883811.1 hypothetical protein BCR41DRAFT_416143 [Lobosporangium transversale]